MSITTTRLILVGPSLCLFLLSLALPAIAYIDPNSALPGYTTGWAALTEGMVIGFMGLWETVTLDDISRFGSISWFASPVLALAWVLLMLRLRRPAVIAGRAAFFLSLLFFICPALPIDHSKEMRNMHGTYGFYVWVTSMALAWHAASRLLPHQTTDHIDE